jgi:hypothetical protein
VNARMDEKFAEVAERRDIEDFEIYVAETLQRDPGYLDWLESLESIDEQ